MIDFDCLVYSKKIKELNRWYPNIAKGLPPPTRPTPPGAKHTHKKITSDQQTLAGVECVVGRLNSGEAAVVGGDDLFGCFPLAEVSFTKREWTTPLKRYKQK